ncbi:hypothetical protein TAMA11512_02080 [Selenomonas sp. TAMA-11512]|uniref:metallophosphoesterase family protein n=1 Tax=Selenomonas sp. TAMA-11512 TaxID=3095337 RepID=UPI00308B82C7|nr:hypothetical protein TAMA11512_02080 [Selenomonas sp. TAMA-11512]
MKFFTRRSFLKLLGMLAFFGGIGSFAAHFNIFSKTAKSIERLAKPAMPDAEFFRQIITVHPEKSRTFMWQSDDERPAQLVELRETGTDSVTVVEAVSEPFTDDNRTGFMHTARIDTLRPGTSFEWRVRDGEMLTEWKSLRTPEVNQPCKVIIFPDSQSADYSGWSELAHAARERSMNADFFINMGDLVDNGEARSQWDDWLRGVTPMIESIPFAPIMGNHETYDRDWNVRLPAAYLAEFATPEVAGSAFPRYYYSFDYGPVHFAVLNTQWRETEDFQAGLLEEQLEWLPRDMAATKKPWKVVLLHKDVLQYRLKDTTRFADRKEGFSDIGQQWMPVFDALDIDLVLSAHLHTYRRRGHIKGFARSENGPLYVLTGVAGDVRYVGIWVDHALDVAVAPQPEMDNYMTLEADDRRLTLRAFLPDGTQIDAASLER